MAEKKREEEIDRLLAELDRLLGEDNTPPTVVLTEDMIVESPQQELPLSSKEERPSPAQQGPAEDEAQPIEGEEREAQPDEEAKHVQAAALQWARVVRIFARHFARELGEVLPELAERAAYAAWREMQESKKGEDDEHGSGKAL